MASAEDSRASANSDEFLQENEAIGSSHSKDTAVPSPSDSSASRSRIEQLFLQGNIDTSNLHRKDFTISSSEDSVADVSNGERASIKSITKPSDFTISNDQSLREQIMLARLHIEEKTKLRDAIQVQVQENWANCQIHGLDYEHAKGEERRMQKLVHSKRMEIDHLLSVINKAKNAQALKDIDNHIFNMEHMQQHETLPLKEEQQLFCEIKQLKLIRNQLSPNTWNPDEIEQALEQREEFEKRLRFLRKELNTLKDAVFEAEVAAVQLGKKFRDENKKFKELQLQLRAANDDLQVAYSHWQSLRKELWDKSKQFSKCKEDTAAASNCACSINGEALYHMCNQMENFMALWNINDEFHLQCVKFNEMASLQRLGTLENCSCGPIEESPDASSYVRESVDRMASSEPKYNSLSQNPTLVLKKETTGKHMMEDSKLITGMINDRPPELGNGLLMVSGKDATYELEVSKKSEKVAELKSKTEKMLSDEDKAELKEKCRLVEVAKANEAREKKKRQEKKIQMRNESKAQKEAEKKEKKRQKRLRKKERKAAGKDASDTNSCITCLNANGKDMLPVELKKSPQKSCVFTKQSKAKSGVVPPPLRNRSKKMYRWWMWLICVIALLLSGILWQGVDAFLSAKLHWKRGKNISFF